MPRDIEPGVFRQTESGVHHGPVRTTSVYTISGGHPIYFTPSGTQKGAAVPTGQRKFQFRGRWYTEEEIKSMPTDLPPQLSTTEKTAGLRLPKAGERYIVIKHKSGDLIRVPESYWTKGMKASAESTGTILYGTKVSGAETYGIPRREPSPIPKTGEWRKVISPKEAIEAAELFATEKTETPAPGALYKLVEKRKFQLPRDTKKFYAPTTATVSAFVAPQMTELKETEPDFTLLEAAYKKQQEEPALKYAIVPQPFETMEEWEAAYKKQQEEQMRLEQRKQQLTTLIKDRKELVTPLVLSTGILSWEDPLSLKSLGHIVVGTAKGETPEAISEKIIETKAKATLGIEDTGLISSMVTGPVATAGYQFVGAAVLGTGATLLGRTQRIGATATKVVRHILPVAGAVGVSAYIVPPIVEGDYEEAFARGGYLLATAPLTAAGFKAGQRLGAKLPMLRIERQPKISSLYTRVRTGFRIKEIPISKGVLLQKTTLVKPHQRIIAYGKTPTTKVGPFEIPKYKLSLEWPTKQYLVTQPVGRIEKRWKQYALAGEKETKTFYQKYTTTEKPEILIGEKATFKYARQRLTSGYEGKLDILDIGTGEYSVIDKKLTFKPIQTTKTFGGKRLGQLGAVGEQLYIDLSHVGAGEQLKTVATSGFKINLISSAKKPAQLVSIPGFAEPKVQRIVYVKKLPFIPVIRIISARRRGPGVGVITTHYEPTLRITRKEVPSPKKIKVVVTGAPSLLAYKKWDIDTLTKTFLTPDKKPKIKAAVKPKPVKLKVLKTPRMTYRPTEQATLLSPLQEKMIKESQFVGRKPKSTLDEYAKQLEKQRRDQERAAKRRMEQSTKQRQKQEQLLSLRKSVSQKQSQAQRQAQLQLMGVGTTAASVPTRPVILVPTIFKWPGGKRKQVPKRKTPRISRRRGFGRGEVLLIPKADWLSLTQQEHRTMKKAKHPPITRLTKREYARRLYSPRASIMRFPTAKGWKELLLVKPKKGKKKKKRKKSKRRKVKRTKRKKGLRLLI